jgi:hypothetical protein
MAKIMRAPGGAFQLQLQIFAIMADRVLMLFAFYAFVSFNSLGDSAKQRAPSMQSPAAAAAAVTGGRKPQKHCHSSVHQPRCGAVAKQDDCMAWGMAWQGIAVGSGGALQGSGVHNAM